MSDLRSGYWTGRWKMSDEPDPNDLWGRFSHDWNEIYPVSPKIKIPQVQIEIRYLDDYNEIDETWVYLRDNESLRGIVPDQFIDTGQITIYD